MDGKIAQGNILIAGGAQLPDSVQVDGERFSSGWRRVKDLDVCAFEGKIVETGWTFFFRAGDIRSLRFGFGWDKAARRAMQRLLANAESQKVDCLEITQVARKRFLGFPYVRVIAHAIRLPFQRFSESAARFSVAAVGY